MISSSLGFGPNIYKTCIVVSLNVQIFGPKSGAKLESVHYNLVQNLNKQIGLYI